jgi:DNA-binding transcriptional ArsR family regulator
MHITVNGIDRDWESILSALADKNRLLIINELLKRESSVNDLADTLKIQMYNISKHLKILEESGLVIKRKNGIKRIYKISEDLQTRSSNTGRILDLGCCTFIFRP